jgi:superfamily II DNA or RNA helicase
VLIPINVRSIDDYRLFLKAKKLPRYAVRGGFLDIPDQYASQLGITSAKVAHAAYTPHPAMFDYQADITRMAVENQKYAIFADCGLGKTLMLLDYARHIAENDPCGVILIMTPLMVVRQMLEEANRFFPGMSIGKVAARDLQSFLDGRAGFRIGVANYETLTEDIKPGQLRAMILDESSMLKSHYGHWGAQCIRLGKGLPWKLCLTGTPAPNDRVEFANHAIFLDQFPTVNAFLARYFVNTGNTGERWELKPHAVKAFYESLASWSIFLADPSVYGWKGSGKKLPPIHVHIHNVPMTDDQRSRVQDVTGGLFATEAGGIVTRSKLGQISKSGDSKKYEYIRDLVDSWPTESTIIWCMFNREQDMIEAAFPEAASIRGETPEEERYRLIADFKAGRVRVLISKPKVLGFGLNLQIATRQVFSGLQDSYEQYYQAVKRSNRHGSTYPLNVHIPVTDVEFPMISSVLSKADRIDSDTTIQQEMFRNAYAR